MNKKGFTLVELLAVIAILAILVIIALPNVLQMFNDSKKNSFMTEVRDIYKQAQTQFIADNLANPGPRTYASASLNCTGIEALDLQGRSINYIVQLDSTGKVTSIAVSDGSYFYTPTTAPADAANITADAIATSGTAPACPSSTTPTTPTTPGE